MLLTVCRVLWLRVLGSTYDRLHSVPVMSCHVMSYRSVLRGQFQGKIHSKTGSPTRETNPTPYGTSMGWGLLLPPQGEPYISSYILFCPNTFIQYNKSDHRGTLKKIKKNPIEIMGNICQASLFHLHLLVSCAFVLSCSLIPLPLPAPQRPPHTSFTHPLPYGFATAPALPAGTRL